MKKIINAFSVPFLEAKMDNIDNDDLLRKINLMFDSTPIKRTLSQHWFDNVETNSFPLEGYSSFNDPNGDLIKRNEFNFFLSENWCIN